jgi:hypothetical protein
MVGQRLIAVVQMKDVQILPCQAHCLSGLGCALEQPNRDTHNLLPMDLRHIDGRNNRAPLAELLATLWSLGYPRLADVDVLHYRSSIPGGKA